MKKNVAISLVILFSVCLNFCASFFNTYLGDPTSKELRTRGPAGGLIFFDKGKETNGWRYIEAAPVEAEFRGVHSINNIHESLREVLLYSNVGSGKENTIIIDNILKNQVGDWDRVVQKTLEMEINGYNDWYVPSDFELFKMWEVLKKMSNRDHFKDGEYWSSSDKYDEQYRRFLITYDFRNGEERMRNPNTECYVRPIRYVSEDELKQIR